MCYYDQTVFSCGDARWGHFRQHCNREHRTGEKCGTKLVMQTYSVDRKCKRCERLDQIFRRRQAEAIAVASRRHNIRRLPSPIIPRPILTRPTLPSITTVRGDTLQLGTAEGPPTFGDEMGCSNSTSYTSHNRYEGESSTDSGGYNDVGDYTSKIQIEISAHIDQRSVIPHPTATTFAILMVHFPHTIPSKDCTLRSARRAFR